MELCYVCDDVTKIAMAKQSDDQQVQFLCKTVFLSNCWRQFGVGTYWLQRDGPVSYQNIFSRKAFPFQ